jgi:hypothetical protein
VAERSVDPAFEPGAKKKPTGRIANKWSFIVRTSVTTVEQSGVALRFPPHSKVAVRLFELRSPNFDLTSLPAAHPQSCRSSERY